MAAEEAGVWGVCVCVGGGGGGGGEVGTIAAFRPTVAHCSDMLQGGHKGGGGIVL